MVLLRPLSLSRFPSERNPPDGILIFWNIAGVDRVDEGIDVVEHDGFLEVRVSGPFTLPRFKELMLKAVVATKEKRLKYMLLDVRGLEGTPSTLDRHELGRSGVENKVDFKVAALVTPEQAKDNFASTVARNRGVNVQTFTDRDKALAWLLGKGDSL